MNQSNNYVVATICRGTGEVLVLAEHANSALGPEVDATALRLAVRSRATLKLGESANERQGERMTGKSEMFKALPDAFWMALLLTGNVEAAEAAVLDGIASLEVDGITAGSLLLGVARSAIHWRVAVPEHSEALSLLRAELRRLFLLVPNNRDCFVLRVLIGLSSELCSEILNLSIHEVEDALNAALQELAFIETLDIARCNSVHPAHDATVDPCTSSGVSAWPPA